jgi:Na+-transporting methylmalonyl-CoA/oxaloacetate decarboxylase gamma subunit
MGGVVDAIFGGGAPEPEPVPSPEEVQAEQDRKAEEEAAQQRIAAAKATNRRKLNSPLTQGLGVEDDTTDSESTQLF